MDIPFVGGDVATHRGILSRDRARTIARRTQRVVTVGAGLLVAVGTVRLPLSGTALATTATTCEPRTEATTQEYLSGVACPPPGFGAKLGYEPVLVMRRQGSRYTKPPWADGHCSGPLADRGVFWNFAVACRTHDYGYDLVRFGVGDRAEADALLYRDMAESCEGQWFVGSSACRVLADSAWVVLTAGDALGFDPERLARG